MIAVYLAMLETDVDRDKFMKLYESYEKKLFAVALRILENNEKAEDAVQQAWLRIIQHWERVSCLEWDLAGGYAVTTVKNAAIDILRQEKRVEPLPATWDPPAREESQDEYQYLVSLIQTLPDTYRRILELKYVEEYSNREIAFLLMLLLLFSCSACGKDDQRNEGSGDSETEQQQPQDDDVQSEDSTDAPGKIVLDGTPVRWDEFPMPTAETFGLTGEDAIIYNAIAQVYNPKVYADTFSQSPEDVTDLSLPAFEIYEKSKSENGNTIYYGVFYECDYYNLGSDLADLNNPVYSLVKGKSPANLTIDAQGNFVDFEQTPESSNDPYGDIRRVCGPMTELADFLCGETETYSKEPLKVPDLNAEAMVIQYLNYYFCQS